MRIKLPLLPLLLAGSMYAEAAEASLKAALETRYAELKADMAARDTAALATLLAPDFISEDASGGRQTRSEMLQSMPALPKDPNKTSETTLESVERKGHTAEVIQQYHMVTRKAQADGALHQVDLQTRSRDIWVQAGSTWLLKETVTLRMDYRIDGVLVGRQEHGPITR